MSIGVIQRNTSNRVVGEIEEKSLTFLTRKLLRAMRKARIWRDCCKSMGGKKELKEEGKKRIRLNLFQKMFAF